MTACRCVVAVMATGVFVAAGYARAAEGPLSFERDIRPIFRAHCFDCHGAEREMKGGLDLRLVRFQQKGGESGPAVVAGDHATSLLWKRIESGEMPPGEAKVTPAEREILKRWIAEGAKTARPEPESIPPGLGVTPEERAYWAFQPIRQPETPSVQGADRVRSPIDAFILTKLEPQGLTLSPDADPAVLVRRLYFDLLGLPPTFEQVQAFVNDPSPGAYERLVDELLQSPQYGERWARHWLDVAGYADSDGGTSADPVREFAYKYRDYVIRSFNADKPFDRFLLEQLAGDELVPPPHANLTPEQIELLVATGFLRTAVDGTSSGAERDPATNQVMADTLKIVSTSLLGVSVACSQCHDHRYDPIPQADYYGLRAVFEPAYNWKNWRVPPQRLVSLVTDADRKKSEEIEAQAAVVVADRDAQQAKAIAAAFAIELEKHPEELRPALKAAFEAPEKDRTPEQKQLLTERPSANITAGTLYQYDQKAADELKKLGEKIEEIRRQKPPGDYVSAMTEIPGEVPPTHLFHRGDYRQPLDVIAPADLQIASPEGERTTFPVDDEAVPTTGRRLAFARWLTSGKHPLVARVLVNRFWLHHFGRGIVNTPGEFGRLGELPTHPELLDWLASDFMASGWHLKALHKRILMSTVYRQSSQRTADRDERDADGRWYSRYPLRRLEAESVRDRILAVNGALNLAQFGPPIPVVADDAGQIIEQGEPTRRSIYLQARRTQPVALLTAFDAPVMDINCERRPTSTVAGQSLMLMNSRFIQQQARKLADRIRRDAAAATLPAIPAELAERAAHLEDPWSYGYGTIDESAGRTVFTRLPHFAPDRWQGSAEFPDATVGYVSLHAQGGHPGKPGFAVIRRWTAVRAGTVSLNGELRHQSENGDGVRGRIVSNRRGILGSWTAKNGGTNAAVAAVPVEPGETLDFVVDCLEHETSDSFLWPVTVQYDGPAGPKTESVSGFHGPTGPSLIQQTALAWRLAYSRDITPGELSVVMDFLDQQLTTIRALSADAKKTDPPADDALLLLTDLCQQLLASNEFLYVE